jgi:FKBP-type peptidyl-prolyl cis-trans isomerase FklB
MNCSGRHEICDGHFVFVSCCFSKRKSTILFDEIVLIAFPQATTGSPLIRGSTVRGPTEFVPRVLPNADMQKHRFTAIVNTINHQRRSGVMRVLSVVLAALVVVSLSGVAQKKAALKTQKQKVSYGIGMDIGKNFKEQFPDVDADALFRGFKDALTGAKPAIDSAELAGVMAAFQQEMMKKRGEKQAAASEKNKKEGEAFLTENKKKDGVVTLPSGLQYKVIKEGTGPKPGAKDTVECNYRGTLIDGKEFDSSYKRGTSAKFVLGQVIPGWIEGLQLMSVGSKYELYIPSNLAYGERGAGADIGPDATLIFEVELLGFK